MQSLETDVVIVGAGAAALVCALDLAPKKVLLLAKARLGEGASSAWAQGGIAAAVGDGDSPASHARDTHLVGCGLCETDPVSKLTEEGPALIEALLNWKVGFDRDEDGQLSLGQEAAHSFRRVLHAKGDGTGKEIMRALSEAVVQSSHITVLDDVQVFDLITSETRVQGVWGQKANGQNLSIFAPATILATGGIGRLFGQTTNPDEACGEGLAMAARAGAVLRDLEFVQFHPTAMDVGLKPMPLVTEALRGEGAKLLDGRGIRFMNAVHDDAELAPRDVVARAIWRKVKQGDPVYLDCRDAVGEAFPERFPTVWGYCQDAGIDPRVQPIRIRPAAHYHMGGIEVDLEGRSSLPGLWAVGEVASTGVHGANRLASNSLLEAVVFGRRAARAVLKQPADHARRKEITMPAFGTVDLTDELSTLMYGACGVERTEAGLFEGLVRIVDWESRMDQFHPAFQNRLLSAKMILACAMVRTESRGGHFRADYPESHPDFEKHTTTTLQATDAFIKSLNLGAGLRKGLQECQTQA